MLNQPEQLWNKCLSVIKDNISEASYNTWFAPIVALKYEKNIFMIPIVNLKGKMRSDGKR